jgi:hypothetical protein
MQARIFLTLLCLCVAIFAGCTKQRVKGNGKPVSESRSVEAFHAIELKGNYQVVIKPGQPQKTIVNTDENVEPFIETTVQNGVLTIKSKSDVNIKPSVTPIVIIDTNELSALSIKGSSDINVEGLNINELTTDIHGSGNIYLAGKTNRLTIRIEGSGKVDSEKLIAKSVIINLKGSGEVSTTAEQNLDIVLSGSGKINYVGNPTSLKQTIRGSGEITHLNTEK